jgi:hypothetical protein
MTAMPALLIRIGIKIRPDMLAGFHVGLAPVLIVGLANRAKQMILQK